MEQSFRPEAAIHPHRFPLVAAHHSRHRSLRRLRHTVDPLHRHTGHRLLRRWAERHHRLLAEHSLRRLGVRGLHPRPRVG